jgi:hypothetical protein
MNESNCKIISFRGIIKSFTGDNIFYVRSHLISSFTIPNRPFILITGNSDYMVSIESPGAKEVLSSNFLIHWFAQNLEIAHSKCSHIPLGIDYHSLSHEEFNDGVSWWGSKQCPLFQEAQLLGIKNRFTGQKINKIYCNFLHVLHLPERAESLKKVKHTHLVIEPEKLPRITTWNNMVKYKFVLSPAGVGLDCHRTWEALVLGCIPIVKSSCIDPVYEGLPVWIIKDWEDANNLDNCPVTNDGSIYLQLTREYWNNKIKNFNLSIRP